MKSFWASSTPEAEEEEKADAASFQQLNTPPVSSAVIPTSGSSKEAKASKKWSLKQEKSETACRKAGILFSNMERYL